MNGELRKSDGIIRIEKFGNLIWSKKKQCYFLPESPQAKRYVQDLVNNLNTEINLSSLKKEVSEIGISSNYELINNHSKNQLSAPLDIYLDYTWICNLASTCGEAYCYAKNNLGKTTLTIDILYKILLELREMGVMRLHLAGGEPFSLPKILDSYISKCNELGIAISITTNGLLFTPETLNILTKETIVSITVSLDGYDQLTNDKIRGEGTFNKVLQGIELLVQHKNQTKSNYQINLKPVLDIKYDCNWYWNYLQLAERLGVDGVRFNNPERCGFHETGYYGKIVNEYYSSLEVINDVLNNYTGKLSVNVTNNPVNGCSSTGIDSLHGCIGGQELIAIHPNGKVTPCMMNEYNFGSIYDFENLKSLFNANLKIHEFHNNLQLHDDCKQCSLIKGCRGGSQIRKIVEYGSFVKQKDPLCPIDYFERSNKPYPKTCISETAKHFKKIVVAHSL